MARDSKVSKRYYEEDEDDDDEYDFEEFKRRQKKKRRQKNKSKDTRAKHNNNDNSYTRNRQNGYYDRINDRRDSRPRQDDDDGEGYDSKSGLQKPHGEEGKVTK